MDAIQKDILLLPDDQFNPGNVCIVTGAASGIGRATAMAMAANGLTTVGLDMDTKGGHETQSMLNALGHPMTFIPTDLSRDEQVSQAVQEAASQGWIRYVANIAGIQHIDAISRFPMEKYDQMQALMLRAPFLLAKLTMPLMREGPDGCGVIGNMASIHAHICTLNKPVYNIVKFGLRGLTQSISAEGGGKIRSFTISTGFVKTPLMENQIKAQAKQRRISEDRVITEVMLGKSQVKEMMTPLEVANLFVFAFSRFSKYLVGGDILYDGGVVKTY
jgi:3-hydroxybutyrate dehydrogenase